MNRRDFKGAAALTGALPLQGLGYLARRKGPQLTFYGATQQVSGSCHLLECSEGQFVVDAGLFYADRNPVEDYEKANCEFPFDPKGVKALTLTHPHVDHKGWIEGK